MYSWQTVTRSLTCLLLAALAAASCATDPEPASAPPRVIQPGAPGEDSRELGAVQSAAVDHTAADTAFMQGMIGHHAQALEMTKLIAERSESEDLRMLGLRIDVSQEDEIKMMRRWLEKRGEDVPDPAQHMHGELMPGMLSAAQMVELEAATGAEFERLFLRYMIQHHQGALTMVQHLLAQPGAGQQSEIFAFASDVDADQSMEIQRMGAMLAAGR